MGWASPAPTDSKAKATAVLRASWSDASQDDGGGEEGQMTAGERGGADDGGGEGGADDGERKERTPMREIGVPGGHKDGYRKRANAEIGVPGGGGLFEG